MRLQNRITSVLFIILTGLLISTIPVASQSSEVIEYNIPIVETFDLLQVGTTANPYITNLTKDFQVVTKMNWILHFTVTALDWGDFAGGTALSNGIFINYDSGNMIDKNITANHELFDLGFNSADYQDERSPKGHVLWIQHLITSFIEGGIHIDSSNSIHVYIQDDLTAAGLAIDSFSVTFKGYKTIEIQTYNEDFQGEDLLTLIENFWRSNSIALMSIGVSIFGFLLIWRFFKRR